MLRRAFLVLPAWLLNCVRAKPAASAPDIAPVTLSLVQSEPIETTLERPDIPNASDVWLEMFRNAKRSIDISEFYASEAEPQWLALSKLTRIFDALADAQKRGVKVRFLVDEKFVPQYHETLEHMEKAGIQVRRIKGHELFGGVQHAKYFVVDGYAAFIGSQNFDWRSLNQIQEIGVRLYSTEIGSLLLEIFETDWALAGGAPISTRIHNGTPFGDFPGIEAKRVQLVASPKGWLPNEESWELPRIVALMDNAQRSIEVQVLKYNTVDREGNRFLDLENAFRRAASRGVKVRLLVSEWALQEHGLRPLQELAPVIEIRAIKIPRWSGGHIPHARVAHAKYLVADGREAWIGSSNWEGDYFTKCRNVGVILSGGPLVKRLAKFFEENWTSQYVSPLPSEPLPPSAP